MKKQKDMTLENEPPQVLKVSNMLLGKSGGQFLIAPERMKHLCQSGNDIQSWMCMKWSASISDSMDVNLSKLWETVEDRGPWCAAVQGLQRVGHDLGADQQHSHWSIKELVFYLFYGFYFISFYFILFSLSYLKMSPVIEIYPGLSHTTAIQMSTPRGIFQCLLLLWRSDVCKVSFWLFAAWLILNICLICKWYLPVTAWGKLQMSFPQNDTAPPLFPLNYWHCATSIPGFDLHNLIANVLTSSKATANKYLCENEKMEPLETDELKEHTTTVSTHPSSPPKENNAWYRMLGAGALGWPRGMVQGGRWERGSGWGTHVYPWQIHVDVCQNQYNIVKYIWQN